jgi:hypothetical protein
VRSRLVAADVSAHLAEEWADSFGARDAAPQLAADAEALCAAWRPFCANPHGMFKARACVHACRGTCDPPCAARSLVAPADAVCLVQALVDAAAELGAR